MKSVNAPLGTAEEEDEEEQCPGGSHAAAAEPRWGLAVSLCEERGEERALGEGRGPL